MGLMLVDADIQFYLSMYIAEYIYLFVVLVSWSMCSRRAIHALRAWRRDGRAAILIIPPTL